MSEPNNTAKQPRVAVIILTWNRVEDVVTCLESFSEVTYENREVIVVDNASADETVETIKRDFPWATLIVNDTGIYIQNGKGAMITLVGPAVTIDNGALTVT